MERRQFLKTGAAAGLVGSTTLFEPLAKAEQINSASGTIPKRKLGKTGEQLLVGNAINWGLRSATGSPLLALFVSSQEHP